jgi:mono/diheme cytochrome c family protein
MRLPATVSMLLALAACSSEPSGEPDAQPAQTSAYQAQIAPLFRQKCATCHLTGQEAGKMQMTPDQAIASIVNVKADGAPALIRVVPGKPDESYLIMKLEGTHLEKGGIGATMPFGQPPLSPAEIADIRKWIADGAKR